MEYGKKVIDAIIGFLISRSDRNKIDKAVRVLKKSDVHEQYFVTQLSVSDQRIMHEMLTEELQKIKSQGGIV